MTTRPDISRPMSHRQPRYIQDVLPVGILKQPTRRRRTRFKRSIKVTFFSLLAMLIGAGVLINVRPWQNRSVLPVEQSTSSQKVEAVAGISTKENPVVLYVTDKNKVSQPFLEKAENGDEVRLYYQAKKAVLYRPSTNEVISTGDFTPPPAKVFLRQGTQSDNRAQQAEASLNVFGGVKILSKDRSASLGYANTLVIDISGRYPLEVKEITKLLGGTQADIPANETVPDADILVIVGGR